MSNQKVASIWSIIRISLIKYQYHDSHCWWSYKVASCSSTLNKVFFPLSTATLKTTHAHLVIHQYNQSFRRTPCLTYTFTHHNISPSHSHPTSHIHLIFSEKKTLSNQNTGAGAVRRLYEHYLKSVRMSIYCFITFQKTVRMHEINRTEFKNTAVWALVIYFRIKVSDIKKKTFYCGQLDEVWITDESNLSFCWRQLVVRYSRSSTLEPTITVFPPLHHKNIMRTTVVEVSKSSFVRPPKVHHK